MADAGAPIELRDLGPDSADLEPGRGAGVSPGLVARRSLRPGVWRLRLALSAPAGSRGELLLEVGGEPERTPLPEVPPAHGRLEAQGRIEVDTFLHVRRAVTAVRLRPSDRPGSTRLERFELTAVPAVEVLARSALAKVRDLRARRRVGPGLRVALDLLRRGELGLLREKLVGSLGDAAALADQDYQRWLRARALDDAARAALRAEAASWTAPPTISVLVPVFDPPERWLRACLDSVLAQLYPRWELVLADDASTAPHVALVLAEYAARDARVKVVRRARNGGISAATNSALEVASGSFVALVDHDDVLDERALLSVARALVANPALDMVYTDEDKLDARGRRCFPFWKPGWSPEYLLACMYTCHLGVYRASLVRELGGLRSAFDGSQDHDLVLRLMTRAPRVAHVPEVLYSWRMVPGSTAVDNAQKPYAQVAARRALEDWLSSTGRGGAVEDGPAPGFFRVRPRLRGRPRVSIVIPTAARPVTIDGRASFWALRCVEGVMRRTGWRELDVVVLVRGACPPALASALADLGARVIRYEEPFHWGRVNGLGAASTSGEQLLFLNDDVLVLEPGWLEALLDFSQEEQVGAVGARLLFPDGRLQHAGLTIVDGKPGHPHRGREAAFPGIALSTRVHRDVCAVTGACLMTRRSVFESLGGFDDAFPLNYGDVDYGLRVLASGRRVVYQPHATLRHEEGATQEGGTQDELARFQARWPGYRDPYVNANLGFEDRLRVSRPT